MASGIQQGIASKYYAMAEDARTPDQINQVRQLLAKTIQSGGLPAYEGIPIVEQLNGKYQTALQQQAMAGQTQAGLIPRSSQPMAQDILAEAQQSEEEEDSGIDELTSNLPTEEYAEGGIVGFANGGVTGGGEMQLTVPISIGGENGSGPYTGFGGSGFNGGGGYAPPGGPQGGSAGSLASLGRGAQQMQPPAGSAPQAQSAQAQGAQMNMQENAQSAQGMSNDVNGFTPIQTNQGTLLAGQFLQGLSGMPQDQQESSKAMGSMPFGYQQMESAPQPTLGMASGGIVGLAGGGDAYSEAYERIFGKKDKTPGGPSASTSSKGVNIPSMTGAGRPSVPIIGPPPGQVGAIPSLQNLGPAPTVNEKGIGKLIPNFSGPASSSSFLSKIGKRLPVIGGYLTAAEVANLGIQGLVDSDKGTASEFLDPIAAMQGTSGGTYKGKPQLDGSAPTKNVPTPDAIPPNVQTVLDQYKNSKKLGDTPISNKPNAPAKAPAAPREEMGPPRDLMAAAEAPVLDTTPKEDTISKLEKMFTQPPEQKKKERDLDFYTRLFQAGIGVASGSSRNALENLKEAQPAIAGFASDIARQREEDRNRIKDLASLGLKREEFAFKLKELGIADKKVESLTKHYADYLKLGEQKNKILEKYYGNVAANAAASAANANTRLGQTLTNAQDRNITNLIKTYANNPKYMNASPAELRALAMQSLGYGGGAGVGTPTLSYADFSKGLK